MGRVRDVQILKRKCGGRGVMVCRQGCWENHRELGPTLPRACVFLQTDTFHIHDTFIPHPHNTPGR